MKATDLSRRRVLVTGAGGRVGRRLVPALVRLGASVVVTGRSIPSDMACLVDHSVRGDLADPHVVATAFHAIRTASSDDLCRDVIHLAGVGGVAGARLTPQAVCEENVLRTQDVLEECRRAHIRRFLFSSTGLVYGTRGTPQPFTEDSVPSPCSVYAATKLAAEAVVQGYARGYGVSCDIIRLSNVYGPDSPEETVVGRILRQLRDGCAPHVQSLSPIRDFIYVDDVVKGFILLLQGPEEPGCRVVNLSTGVGTSIAELVRLARVAAGDDGGEESHPAAPAEDVVILANDRLEARTGWRPTCSLVEGLRKSLHREEVPWSNGR